MLQISQLEFSRDRKIMSVRCRRQNQDTLYVKGAPEAVLARCSRVSHILSTTFMGCMLSFRGSRSRTCYT